MKFRLYSIFACVGSAALFVAALAPSAHAQKITLGAARTYAVLAGPAVTLTDATIVGNVGVDHGPLTQTTSTISGTVNLGDLVAYDDLLTAYAAIGKRKCGQVITGNLAGRFLTPGTYCVDAASTTTGGVLTLVGRSTDTWVFKIGTSGTGALTGTNFNVVMSSGDTCNLNVYWWTAQAATLTDSNFIGTILAGADVTVTRGNLAGQALARGAVTVTGVAARIAVCTNRK